MSRLVGNIAEDCLDSRKKVLLIFPPNVHVIPPFSLSKKQQPPLIFGFPLGLGYIAAHLEGTGRYEVRILDGNTDGSTIPVMLREAAEFRPDYIGITSYTINVKVAIALAEELKKSLGTVPVIFGGPHVSDTYRDLLRDYSSVDYAVVGEGEISMAELLDVLGGNADGVVKDVKDVMGVAYRDPVTRDVVFTGARRLVHRIDDLPVPARYLVDFDKYIKRENLLPYAIEIMGSRGCTHRCAFCSFQKVWRGRRPEAIVAEMKALIERYPRVKSFLFYDDNFSAKKKRVMDLCQAIIDAGLEHYMWSCLCRADQVDEEMLALMKRAGCTKIMFGMETVDPEVMKNLNKKIDPMRVKEIADSAVRLGMDALVFFIIGNPGDTMDSIRRSCRFARQLKSQSSQWSIMQVYPGTRLAELQPCEDFTGYLYEPEVEEPSTILSANVPVFENPGLDRETMKRLYRKIVFQNLLNTAVRHPLFALKKYYRSPLNAMKYLLSVIKG